MLIRFLRVITQFIVMYFFITIPTQNYTNKKLTSLNKVLLLVFSILTSITLEILRDDLSFLVYLICIIPLVILYKNILKCSTNYTLINMVVLYLITSTSEILSYFTLKLIFNPPFIDLFSNERLVLIYECFNMIFSLMFLSLFFLSIKKLRKKLNEAIDILSFKELLILIALSLAILLPEVLKVWINPTQYDLNMLALSIAQLTVVFILLLLYFRYTNSYKNAISKLNQVELDNRTLSELVDELRVVKHDYNNILQSINGYIITKQYDELDKHIKTLIKQANKISEIESINPQVINQPAIYGVIGAKYFNATKKNIKFNLNILADIREISFDFTELSRILGILLDNAIEASEKSELPYISVEFSYNKYRRANIIEIRNSVAPDIKIDTSKIFNKGVSSKKIKSGIGLWEVKKIIASKSNSQICADICDNGDFSQTIIIEKI